MKQTESNILRTFLAFGATVILFSLYILMSVLTPAKDSSDGPLPQVMAVSVGQEIKLAEPISISAPATSNKVRSNMYFLPCEQTDKKDELEAFSAVNGEEAISYREDDLLWLSRIIYAEAGCEPLEGKLAVGSVVMNRVANKNYPDTIYGVIFDRKYGVQFTPASTNAIYKEPNKDSILAAKMCLGGYSVSDEILFFQNDALATSTWTKDNRPFVMTIGNHDFYS